MKRSGRLVLCSYGSGDPDLLPVKTVSLLNRASLVILPESAPPQIVDLIPGLARSLVFACDQLLFADTELWKTVLDEVDRGGIVVRLYAESPQLDSTALQEARKLSEHGLAFEVVPEPVLGLEAASYSGVPLDLEQGMVVLAGHQPIAPLSTMASGTAIVVVDQNQHPHEAAENLIRAGFSSTTPCLVIHRPTHPSQDVRESFLGNLGVLTESATGGILVAGNSIRQRPHFAWFEHLPLFRKRVLVTRARYQATEMSHQLCELGAEPVELPTIEIVPPSDLRPLEEAIAHIGDYDWVVFTSVNGVSAFFEQLDTSGKDLRALGRAKMAAIGSATAAALRRYGAKPDFVPERFVAEEVLTGLLDRAAGGCCVLLPRAEQARDVLPDGLRRSGAKVDVVPAYKTVMPKPPAGVLTRVRNGDIDIVTLTASSAARNLAAILDSSLDSLSHALIACIGPITAETARQVGFHVDIVAEEYSVPGLIAAIVAASERNRL